LRFCRCFTAWAASPLQFSFFFVVLRFELNAYTSTSFVMDFLCVCVMIVSCKLFAWADLEPEFYWCLPPQ
jgi:hypothetical protein